MLFEKFGWIEPSFGFFAICRQSCFAACFRLGAIVHCHFVVWSGRWRGYASRLRCNHNSIDMRAPEPGCSCRTTDSQHRRSNERGTTAAAADLHDAPYDVLGNAGQGWTESPGVVPRQSLALNPLRPGEMDMARGGARPGAEWMIDAVQCAQYTAMGHQ
jgi:hypothetical protein